MATLQRRAWWQSDLAQKALAARIRQAILVGSSGGFCPSDSVTVAHGQVDLESEGLNPSTVKGTSRLRLFWPFTASQNDPKRFSAPQSCCGGCGKLRPDLSKMPEFSKKVVHSSTFRR